MTTDDLDAPDSLVLSDLVNRVLDKGAVISGHVVVSVAGIDLLLVDLRILLSSIESALQHQRNVDASLLPPANGTR